MITRRGLLARMPGAALAAGVGATQLPALASRLTQPAYGRIVEITQSDRLQWFVAWLENVPRPVLSLPGYGAPITRESIRAIVQWEQFTQLVTETAIGYQVPAEDALRLAGIKP